ncbi:uncharacterized protein LOC131179833 isoform X2 [Hevea brasiliensis]|uniref:uncharacterized protein LOC131179833 isoform X2 n=1 Tax=Hevea brasiliensis TaxID=3981 RepID=UPI0025E6DD23|nr:uncharacterized protein LOC131179833 isoform X2 [Hevea brasiliensis]
MEELPGGVLTQGRVSFKTQQQLQTNKNAKLFEQRCWNRANDEIMATRTKHYHYESLNIPLHAMEFLCRSWSPTASGFLQTLSSSNILDIDDHKQRQIGEHEEKVDHNSDVLGEQEGIIFQVDDGKKHAAQSNKKLIWRIKGWLRENSLTGILRWKREKKKEEVRLLTAKIHAALSVARLAAAIAGFAATNSMEIEKNMDNETVKISNGVACASALLASACAEAAESVGAHRADVASAVNSGLTIQTPADIITLTAAAATGLRGAATLESRATSILQFPDRNKEPVKLAAKLSIITPSEQKVLRLVSIHLKHRQLMLCLEKKYMGVLTTSEEYTILQVIREKKVQGYYLLGIKCNGGDIKLLFEDKKQLLVWISSISSFLQMHNSYHVK